MGRPFFPLLGVLLRGGILGQQKLLDESRQDFTGGRALFETFLAEGEPEIIVKIDIDPLHHAAVPSCCVV